MLSKKISGLTIILIVVLLSGCGPSPEEQTATAVALTATAATRTPTITPTFTPTPTYTPTPTPTPIPYDLSVLVVDEDDMIIAGVKVTLSEIESEAGAQTTDDTGQVIWVDLPGDSVTLLINAQGYFFVETTEIIKRGANQVTIVMERDPFGQLPSEVCAPGEKLLYVEDFQDGHAEGWQDIEFRAQGWDLGPQPDIPEDIVILHWGTSSTWTRYEPVVFENSVLRFQYMITGPGQFAFHWHVAPDPYEIEAGLVDDSRYQADFLQDKLYVHRITLPIQALVLQWSDLWNPRGIWHNVEISTYDGVVEIWRDGHRLFFYTDPQPIPGGGLMIEAAETPDEESVVFFNNFSVCELTAPFVPMPTQEP
jgi:hypothetical protein